MEKVSLYIKKILSLALSFSIFFVAGLFGIKTMSYNLIWISAVGFILFAYLDFKISGEKPRFLFGMNQSDAYLNSKGGFWNLFKWIVTLFGFLYDMVIWTLWGVFLLFNLFVDFLLLVRTIVYWIIFALIWFIRQLFPPIIFIFRMFIHYIINWAWWIYQVAVRNVKKSINKNFYFIALWGSVPAMFIVFLFYGIAELSGMPELILLSTVFALVPLVWSFGEIAALRFEKRESEEYSSVRFSFGNGFDSLRSLLFYLVAALILIIAEVLFNLLGWIPSLSLSLIGIAININTAISLVLLFLLIIILFAGSMLPTHILYHPEHENDLNSSIRFLRIIGRKFLRYSFAGIPAGLFASILLVIPLLVIFFTFSFTDSLKDSVLDSRIETLNEKSQNMGNVDAYLTDTRKKRLEMYKDLPLLAGEKFAESLQSKPRIEKLEKDIRTSGEQLKKRESEFRMESRTLAIQIDSAEMAMVSDTVSEELAALIATKDELEMKFTTWKESQDEYIDLLEIDLRELKNIRWQMPILFLLMGILFAVFGGILLAVIIGYVGNVYYELYIMREDDSPSYWVHTLEKIRKKDSNQPLLGFTLLVIILVPLILFLTGVIA